MKVGIEVGGTFTDLFAVDDGKITVAKVPSNRAAPEEGVFAALEAAGIRLAEITELVHGSTVATNAVLERKGGPTALITTAGFTDILLIQRQDRPKVYDLRFKKPAPVVERRHTFGIQERMLANGTAATVPDNQEWQPRLQQFLTENQFASVAVCFLNAYANAAHELEIAAWVRARFPSIHVSCSHEVSREFREYERASTTALSAYVQPVIDSYLGRFKDRLQSQGFGGTFSIMQSNGGRLPAEAIRRNSITALFSGPAGGVAGAVRMAQRSGFKNLITLDMGGTSSDVCLVSDGMPVVAAGTMVEGLPVRTPVVDIATVGAGGGSLIWRDEGGMLHVGPQSSGANPGPACYGRGGVRPTVTDAHVVRGTLLPGKFLGGKMTLDVNAARSAFSEITSQFGGTPEQMADSAIRLADANIVRAIRQISTELGVDPRDYVLVPFGGAGPLHAGRIAEDLGIHTVVVPQYAGVLSALGLVVSDFTQYEVETRKIPLNAAAPDSIRSAIRRLQNKVSADFAANGVAGAISWRCTLQMRFTGQAFEIDVPLDTGDLDHLDEANLRSGFAAVYRKIYSSISNLERPLDIVGIRLGAAVLEQADLPIRPGEAAANGQNETCHIFENKQERDCAVCATTSVTADMHGPLLVNDDTSTLYVPPGWAIAPDVSGNLIMRFKA